MSTVRVQLPPSSMAIKRRPLPTAALDAAQLLGSLLAYALAGAYFLRGTLLAYGTGNVIESTFAQSAAVSLIAAFFFVLLGGFGRVNRCGLVILTATGLSLWYCERFDDVLSRWIGWVMLVAILGPLIYTRHAILFRSTVLGLLKKCYLAATVLSAAWWATGMPNLGRGDFTGVMWHSMLLAPIAALTGIYAVAQVCSRGKSYWGALYGLSLVVVLLASSRSALLGLVLGTIVVLVIKARRKPILSITALFFSFQIALFPVLSLELVTSLVPGELLSGLARKSFNHSRELHWEARWDEFLASPVYGVGFSSAWEGTVGVDDESGGVETGSSYLALLSMTGCLGAGAFFLLMLSLALKTFRKWSQLSEYRQMEICGIASFWVVHLGAEGYIYAVGSLVGATFWLWVGCLDDRLRSLSHSSSSERSRRKPKGMHGGVGMPIQRRVCHQ